MARDRGRAGCAAESAARHEQLVATASRVRRWLVVEQPGPWGREALVESRLDEVVARTVRSHARRAGVRVLLARRPGWADGPGTRRVYLARSAVRHRWIEAVDVDDPHDLVGLDLTALAADEPPGIGRPGPAAVHLVCTNGKHDPCCADRGRPVVRALQDSGAEEVWESSHVGGDRFAANLVVLPTGVYYGRVTPEDAPRLVRDLAGGLLDLDHYRGRSCHRPFAQAADAFARRELDERRLDGLQVLSLDASDDRATVVVARDGERFEVAVSRRRAGAAALTCADHGTSTPWSYRLESFTTSPCAPA